LLHFPAVKVVPNKSLKVVGETFDYTVDLASNSMDIVVSDDATTFLHEGDTVLITNSTSQYDADGFLVNRNNPYVVRDV
jgi:hypothetical protein